MKIDTDFNKTRLALAVNLAAGLGSGLAIAAPGDVVLEGDLYIPNMPSQATGAPVCIDALSGQLVANCDGAVGPPSSGTDGSAGAAGGTQAAPRVVAVSSVDTRRNSRRDRTDMLFLL